MKKITDERLVLQNLKNMRVLFLFQNFGMMGILAYDFLTRGLDGMTDNPLWYLFIMTSVVSAYLSMSISVDHEESSKSPKKRLGISIVVVVTIASIFAVLTSLSEGYDPVDGGLVGLVLFVCGLIPVLYVYSIRKKRMKE
ncbi:hypothetical protein FGG79_03560 [Bacillus sp. BHET2]|uniref:hypothetical protein n=1 Tax=Bacillus sp. BHET2 TaxID=2583818 RepID=UPI00110E8E21|nr:hypothetical protein [Bacillus sp. BHET2]TMU87224.1 hypothetical protein FGG79_03560 [Bacillus sp. BHET2]